MAFPLIGAALAVLTPVIKDVVMDVVKDVAMDIGKSFVDTIGKGIKDFAGDLFGKGAKIVGDLIKNPLDALKDISKKLIPPGFQQLLGLGQSVMQAATNILQKLLSSMNININVSFGGAQGAQAGQGGTLPTLSNQDIVNAFNPQSIQAPAHHAQQYQNTISSMNNSQGAGGTSNTSSAQGTSGTSGSSGASSSPTSNKQFDDLRSLMKSDPKAFGAAFEKLSEGEKIAFQENQQAMNRMFQMMSQMLQIQHDTNKAIINNMRV